MRLRTAVVVALVMSPMLLVAQTSPASDTALANMDTVTHRIDAVLPAGRVIQRMVSRADTSQRYALYLPSVWATWSSARTTP
jgi:hypothetical protein